MPAYTLDLDIRDTDQVFSYKRKDKEVLHFNASLLERIRLQVPKAFRLVTLDVTDEIYNLVLTQRGIEEDHLARLTGTQLRAPGLGIEFDDGGFVLIDGNHRLVRRYRAGVKIIKVWVTVEYIWRHCLIKPVDPRFEELIVADLPPILNPDKVITSRAVINED